jgi:hypothetical protein
MNARRRQDEIRYVRTQKRTTQAAVVNLRNAVHELRLAADGFIRRRPRWQLWAFGAGYAALCVIVVVWEAAS